MDSIELRPASEADLDALCALVNRSEHHDGIPRVLDVDELRMALDKPYISLADDTRVALVDGELAGWGWIWNAPAEARQERAFLFGEVDPSHRGKGVGRQLLAWSLERATARLRSRAHDLPKYIRVDAFDSLEANHRLYARFGFTPTRWFEELGRPLTDLPELRVPDGIALEPWPDGRDEELRQVRSAAFADHWGSAPITAADWNGAVRGPGARADLSVIAVDTASGEVVGLCLNHAFPQDDALTGRHEAWIDNLATLRPWRGRGIASAMLVWSLARFEKEGFDHAMLGVDADSPTGAARLYRALGFAPERRSITGQIELA